jgi:hypothetical protein
MKIITALMEDIHGLTLDQTEGTVAVSSDNGAISLDEFQEGYYGAVLMADSFRSLEVLSEGEGTCEILLHGEGGFEHTLGHYHDSARAREWVARANEVIWAVKASRSVAASA